VDELFPTSFSPANARSTLEGLRHNHPVLGLVDKSPSEQYGVWASNMREQLVGTLTRNAIGSLFAGPLHLAAVSGAEPQIVHANAAVTDVCGRIGEISDELKKVMDRIALSDSLPLVIDTNLILEYEPIESIDWVKFMGEPVRLVIPLRVFEELEEARYSNSKQKSQIARDELPRIVAMVEQRPGHPARISDQTDATIELFDMRHEGLRPSWADDEILAFCATLRQFLPRAILITADGPLLARARYRGFDVRRGPSDRLRHRRTALVEGG
jgi:hypothetical protein